jgi:hypothetical protein
MVSQGELRLPHQDANRVLDQDHPRKRVNERELQKALGPWPGVRQIEGRAIRGANGRWIGLPKLTADVHEAIIKSVGAGNHRHVAAADAGVLPQTLDGWLSVGRQLAEELAANPDFPVDEGSHQAACLVLLCGIVQSEAQFEGEATKVWQSQFTRDWNSVRVYLERRHPDRWKERKESTVAGGDTPIKVLIGIDTSKV